MILVQTTECGMVMMLKVLKIKCGVICNLTSVTIYIYIYIHIYIYIYITLSKENTPQICTGANAPSFLKVAVSRIMRKNFL